MALTGTNDGWKHYACMDGCPRTVRFKDHPTDSDMNVIEPGDTTVEHSSIAQLHEGLTIGISGLGVEQ